MPLNVFSLTSLRVWFLPLASVFVSTVFVAVKKNLLNHLNKHLILTLGAKLAAANTNTGRPDSLIRSAALSPPLGQEEEPRRWWIFENTTFEFGQKQGPSLILHPKVTHNRKIHWIKPWIRASGRHSEVTGDGIIRTLELLFVSFVSLLTFGWFLTSTFTWVIFADDKLHNKVYQKLLISFRCSANVPRCIVYLSLCFQAAAERSDWLLKSGSHF